MRKTEFCNHYRAMSEHATCGAGIAYDTFNGMPFEARPCFCRNGDAPPGCEQAVFPTPEEIAARDELLRRRFERVGKAREAIVESLGGPWKRGTKGSAGAIDCPNCAGEKSLRFTRSGYNGHIHAACKTADCCSWME